MSKVTCDPKNNKVYNSSDSRFIIRLFLSWLIWLTVWAAVISIVIFAAVSIIGVVLFVVGHFIIYHTIADHIPIFEHTWTKIFEDTGIGFVAVFLSGLIIALIIFVGMCIYDEHYKYWLAQQQNIVKKNSSLFLDNIKPYDALIKITNTPTVVNIDFIENGQERDIMDTIPVIVSLIQVYNLLFPYTSKRRYFMLLAYNISFSVLLISIYFIITWYIGSCIIPTVLHNSKGEPLNKPSDQIAHILLSWCVGVGVELVTAILGAIIWGGIIDSCIKEWNIHQNKKKETLQKQL